MSPKAAVSGLTSPTSEFAHLGYGQWRRVSCFVTRSMRSHYYATSIDDPMIWKLDDLR